MSVRVPDGYSRPCRSGYLRGEKYSRGRNFSGTTANRSRPPRKDQWLSAKAECGNAIAATANSTNSIGCQILGSFGVDGHLDADCAWDGSATRVPEFAPEM